MVSLRLSQQRHRTPSPENGNNRLEDQVPENHLLRLIDRHVNFEFIRAKLKDS